MSCRKVRTRHETFYLKLDQGFRRALNYFDNIQLQNMGNVIKLIFIEYS